MSKISVLISKEAIETRIQEMADKINREYEGQEVHLIGILKGSVFFVCELAKRLTIPVTMDFMSVSSYGAGTESTGRVKIVMDLSESIKGQNVIIVEDIIDSGNTLSYLMPLLSGREPASIRLITLLDKPDRRQKEVPVDDTGFTIPDAFVVGYGLDYAQKYRNLPYIGVIDPEA
ncbi:MAG: hypoxanthine phosphoribosyltransferase [Clostridium sp.]|nr:hypoxanthine phosphoribosyltransferase [Clostridium sp.]